jgi:hypothetical protein
MQRSEQENDIRGGKSADFLAGGGNAQAGVV